MRDFERRGNGGANAGERASEAGAPGKRTLTETIQYKQGGASAEAAPPAPGGGAPLAGGVRSKMEGAFNYDFGSVRVHEGEHASAMGAVAYTQGDQLHFAPGQYDPSSQRGQELIGHELAHVVQQGEGRVAPTTQFKGQDVNDDSGSSTKPTRGVPALRAARRSGAAVAARHRPAARSSARSCSALRRRPTRDASSTPTIVWSAAA